MEKNISRLIQSYDKGKRNFHLNEKLNRKERTLNMSILYFNPFIKNENLKKENFLNLMNVTDILLDYEEKIKMEIESNNEFSKDYFEKLFFKIGYYFAN
jgi:hypothetical protein